MEYWANLIELVSAEVYDVESLGVFAKINLVFLHFKSQPCKIPLIESKVD